MNQCKSTLQWAVLHFIAYSRDRCVYWTAMHDLIFLFSLILTEQKSHFLTWEVKCNPMDQSSGQISHLRSCWRWLAYYKHVLLLHPGQETVLEVLWIWTVAYHKLRKIHSMEQIPRHLVVVNAIQQQWRINQIRDFVMEINKKLLTTITAGEHLHGEGLQ